LGNKSKFQAHLKTATNVINGDVALVVLVNNLESFDVLRNLVFAEVDRNLLPGCAVHHLSHFVSQEFRSFLDLDLKTNRKFKVVDSRPAQSARRVKKIKNKKNKKIL